MTAAYSISHHALERWHERVCDAADASDVKRAAESAVQIPRHLSAYFGECSPGAYLMWSVGHGVMIVACDQHDGVSLIVTCYPPRKGQKKLLTRLGLAT